MLKLTDIADFGWGFGQHFFIQAAEGNFVWSDPDYGGDNTIKPFNGSYNEFIRTMNIPFCRDKGRNTIAARCGNDVKILTEEFK